MFKPLIFTFLFAGALAAYCEPNKACWPSAAEISNFDSSLSTPGNVKLPGSVGYVEKVRMKNTRVTANPAMIVNASTNNDVKRCLEFADRFNIRIAVQSSGHDFQVTFFCNTFGFKQ